jgi:hypothetical protein
MSENLKGRDLGIDGEFLHQLSDTPILKRTLVHGVSELYAVNFY